MEKEIQKILPLVQTPARYLGKEINAYHKEFSESKVKFALCYPDIYEIGMSSLGIRILYGILNETKDILCDRFFAPALDMENILRDRKIPLFTLESGKPVRDFDFVGFSISSELNFTNFLNLLSLSGIPVFSEDRKEKDSIVVVGGNCTFNPAPLEKFTDVFVIGEGEEVILEIVDKYASMKGEKREKILESFSKIEGVFVPGISNNSVKKRIVKKLNIRFSPVKYLVPLTEIIHDRISVEIMRGCVQGCKFCQAGACWKPVRTRSAEEILEIAKRSYKWSGYEEISLLSFSSGDHPEIEKIVDLLLNEFQNRKVAISFPSLRIDTFSFKLANKVREIRKTSLTFAPESSERLRYLMRKKIKNEELIQHAKEARKAGWRQIKLYFMLGLPGEIQKDIEDIAELIFEISGIIKVKVSFNTFIPKPHTLLEREKLISKEEFEEKKKFLLDKFSRNRYLKMNFHPYEMSCVETFLGRGNRNLANVIYRVWKKGAKMENWREHFDFKKWQEAFEEENMHINYYLAKQEDSLPYKFIKI